MHDMGVPGWAVWLELALRGVWFVSAAAVAVPMGRLGHDRQLWALIGLFLGPLAVPVSVMAVRRADRRPPRVLAKGRPGDGDRDVLVYVDASRTTSGASAPVGRNVRRVVLAAIVGRDEIDRSARAAELRRAGEALRGALEDCARGGIEADAVVLEGRPARALLRYARSERLEVVCLPRTPAGDQIAREVATTRALDLLRI